ncbi:hypothetical protein [Pseudoroseomonas cervicalis]|uniref:hypothetical protein n=1 Tax=Teichococcus cervicalis TaxID=204525 RepID=UPI00278203BB|nr:hypothetical protein [Pseudoroseomonas cervicalis]MDQ1079710.1 hypothetical protein [Pseudoroseomonas cervicalis]
MSAARGMATGPAGVALHEHVERRARRLVAWLAANGGAEWRQCPSNGIIAEALAIGSIPTARKTVHDAAALGLLEVWAPPGGAARMVRITAEGMALPELSGAPQVADGSFRAWLRQAGPGARHAYYQGRLAQARDARNCLLPPARIALDEADRASEAHALGLVLLVQQPLLGGDGARYLAIRTRKPLPKGAR